MTTVCCSVLDNYQWFIHISCDCIKYLAGKGCLIVSTALGDDVLGTAVSGHNFEGEQLPFSLFLPLLSQARTNMFSIGSD